MKGYFIDEEAARIMGISVRRLRKLCSKRVIEGSFFLDGVCYVPIAAVKTNKPKKNSVWRKWYSFSSNKRVFYPIIITGAMLFLFLLYHLFLYAYYTGSTALAQQFIVWGGASNEQGEFQKAIYWYSMAIKFHEPVHLVEQEEVRKQATELNSESSETQKHIEIDLILVEAYLGRALAYRWSGQPDKAIDDYNQLIFDNPFDFRAYNNRGNAFLDMEQYSLAEEDYSKAIELYPEELMVYENRGLVRLRLGKPEKALEDYQYVLSIDDQDAEAYWGRGVAEKELGQFAASIDDFRTYLRLIPGATDSQEIMGWIEEMERKIDNK